MVELWTRGMVDRKGSWTVKGGGLKGPWTVKDGGLWAAGCMVGDIFNLGITCRG